MQFRIEALDVGNALQNYIWMLIDTHHHQAIAIDPTQADLVLKYCDLHNLELVQIWITHKHLDHIGGLAELRLKTKAQIFAPLAEKDKIDISDFWVKEADTLTFSTLKIDVIATPGHTLGHVCYFIDALDALFSGDTLFAMGCGRLFEGSYEQMYHSLNRLAALPPRTKLYCAHEYTESNAKFALAVEPENVTLQERYQDVLKLREQHIITLPSTIDAELQTNPFLRCQSVEEFQKVRQLKDQF